MSLFHVIRNWLDFPLRSQVRWSRKGLHFINEPKNDLFESLPEKQRTEAVSLERRLRKDYHLTTYYHSSRAAHYQESVYYLHMLESALEASNAELPDAIRAADIGVSHWFYVQALYSLLIWWHSPNPRKLDLTGYEVDAFRPYADLYSRFDHAQAHIDGLPNVHYSAAAFETDAQPRDLVFSLFPFVTRREHLRWGLPVSLFRPEDLVQTAYESLAPRGLLILVNQGPEERDIQHSLLNAIGVQVLNSFLFESPLFRYDQERHISIVQHP